MKVFSDTRSISYTTQLTDLFHPGSLVHLRRRVRAKRDQANHELDDNLDTWWNEMRSFDPAYQLYCEVISWQWIWLQDYGWITLCEKYCKHVYRADVENFHSQPGQGVRHSRSASEVWQSSENSFTAIHIYLINVRGTKWPGLATITGCTRLKET